MRRHVTPVALALLAASCAAIDHADLKQYVDLSEFVVTENEVPDGAEVLASVSFEKTGFYLLGVLPIVPIQLQESVDAVVQRARALGATGVAHLSFDYVPPSALKFAAFPLPDWSAGISISGLAYRMREGVRDPALPPR